MDFPVISVIIPVYNSEKVVGRCLEALSLQDYPKDKVEVIMPDAGSKDKTMEVIKSYGEKLNIRVCENPLKTGEAGKSVGIENSKGEILAFIDSDNIMPDSGFMKRMLRPFLDDPEIFGTEPWQFVYRKEDRPLTKYFALQGANDPLCLYIGNYDKLSAVTGKWTGMKLDTCEKDDYIVINLDEKRIPTIGANGTFIRRKQVLMSNYKPYMFDIDVVYDIITAGYRKFAKVKTGIIHIYAPDLGNFIKKQQRRISDFLHFEKQAQRTYPWSSFPAAGVVKFVLYCVTIVPLLLEMTAGFIRRPHYVWFYHLPVSYITLVIYGFTFIKSRLTGKTAIKNRDKW